MRSFLFNIFTATLLFLTEARCDDVTQRYIRSPEVFDGNVSGKKSVFLAGSAAYPWRERFKLMVEDEDFILLDPINREKKGMPRQHSLSWEIEHIEKADILLTWIPPGEVAEPRTLSMTTLFELGRFAEMREKPLIIGIANDHHMAKELVHQIRWLRPDATLVHTLEELATQLKIRAAETKK